MAKGTLPSLECSTKNDKLVPFSQAVEDQAHAWGHPSSASISMAPKRGSFRLSNAGLPVSGDGDGYGTSTAREKLVAGKSRSA